MEAISNLICCGNSCAGSNPSSPLSKNDTLQQLEGAELQKLNPNHQQQQQPAADAQKNQRNSAAKEDLKENTFLNAENEESSQHRHSHPEFESHYIQEQQKQQKLQHLQHLRNSRPLSEANSEFSCGDPLSDGKSSLELSTTNTSSGIGSDSQSQHREDKRASTNSNDTTSAISLTGSGNYSERKRPALPKHQRPLTRYLPIFSPDLNLRHHIESAGHQIALCPHVFVDSFSCRGYLHKLGATFHGWARRWFVLDRQRNALIYYSDKSERKPRGGAYFSTIDEVYLDHLNASKSGRPHCTFIVKTKKRSYHLQAASDAAARIWIDAIITGAQGNLEY